MKLITSTSSMTVADYIKKTCGNLMFIYYTYLDQLHAIPKDLIDMVDGLLYLEAKSYIMKRKKEE